MASASQVDADRALARALLAETLPDLLSKRRDAGITTRTPREVYVPWLQSSDGQGTDGSRNAPVAARHAVDALARLHADGDLQSFRELMRKVFLLREHVFGGEIFRDAMPALVLEINSLEKLTAVEWFCVDDPTAPTTPPIDVELNISAVTSTQTLEFLSRVTALVERLTSPRSHFRVTMVMWGLGELPLDDEHLLRAMSQLGGALLRRVPTLYACNVSFRVPAGGGDDDGGLRFPHAVGELFQVLSRVGCARLPEPQALSNDDEIDDMDLNRFKVVVAGNAHPRVTAALWSAVAYSCGYHVLEIENDQNGLRETIPYEEADATSTKYLAAALVVGKSDVKRIVWQRPQVLAREADVVARVQAAVRSGNSLAETLWDRGCSVARHSLVFETATLNEAIAGQFGWVMHDPGHGAWIDVFVPGFAQCSVKRDRWNGITRPGVAVQDNTSLEKLCLTINSTESKTPSYSAELTAIIGPSLERLAIQDDRLSPAGLRVILESCPSLRHLKIKQFCPTIEHETVDRSRIVATRLETLELMIQNKTPSSGLFDEFFACVLPVIGANLSRVRIQNPTEKGTTNGTSIPMLPFTESFHALVHSCPRLEELVLERLEVNSLGSLITAYQHNASSLSSLRLLKCPIDSSSLIAFGEALGHPTCLGASKLNLLQIQHTSPVAQDRQFLQGLDLPSIRALLAAMRRNFSLQSLLLLAQQPETTTPTNPLEIKTILDEFEAFRNEDASSYETWRRVQSSKMLISVLQARNMAWNEEIVAQIFEFIRFERRDIGLQFA